MKNVLILCTGNSCRSQIAEGYLRHFAGNLARVYSAGVETHGLNPGAVETMKEEDIDISMQTSNNMEEYRHIEFDYVITVCDNARERCPYFPSKAIKLHHNFSDPAKVTGTEEVVREAFRAARNQIRDFSLDFINKYLNPEYVGK